MSKRLFPNNNITSTLNDEQLSAVFHQNGPLIVIAGAGSGKTKVLTHRIAHLVQSDIKPENILAVTFTNKAANEMKDRVKKLLLRREADFIWIGTFHNICVRILRNDINKLKLVEDKSWNKNFVIYDEADSTDLIKSCIGALELDVKVYVPKNIKALISSLKSQGYDPMSYGNIAKSHREIKISEIFDLYQKELLKNNALDFDDLLLCAVKLLESESDVRSYYHNRFKHVLVDEFQDTNPIQYELIRLISEGVPKAERIKIDRSDLWKGRSITVVGDVDQSIYSWRGADFRIILGFQNDFSENTLIKLEKNYRSTQKILQVADAIIKNNKERIDKVLIPTKEEGSKVVCFEAEDEVEEAKFVAEEILALEKKNVAFKNIGVLYRTNAQSRAIEEALIKKSIPYQIFGGYKFYERKEIKDIVAYLKVIYNPSDSISLKRIINIPRRGLGATTISKIEHYANKNNFSLYKTLLEISDVQGLSEKVINVVRAFTSLVQDFRKAAKSYGITDLLDYVIRKSGYRDELEREGTLEAEERLANLQELFSVAADFEANYDSHLLGDFLYQISLYADLDNLKESTNKVTLLTAHLAKGLEYSAVFICGLEEGLFPHIRSMDSLDHSELEEERRLMYVGVTRAKEYLYFTYAKNRKLFGQSEFYDVSRFINEAPKEYLNFYYGGLDEKVRKNRFHIEKNKIKRKFSDYELEELINLSGVSKVANLQTAQSSRLSLHSFFNVGDKVKHEKFGLGVVDQIFGEGSKMLLNINFEKHGKKLLDPRYAKLIKL